MNLIVLVCFVGLVKSQVQEPAVCQKLHSVYESICSQQSLDIGGHQRNVSSQRIQNEGKCNRIAEVLSRRVQEALDLESGRCTKLWRAFEDAMERIRELEKRPVYCPLRYDRKCFWIAVRFSGIGCNEARQICAVEGGRMANIYSENHHYMLMGYLRMFAGIDSLMTAWLGMTYNPQTNEVHYSNGTRASFSQWHPGFPKRGNEHCCCTGLNASANWKKKNQNMFNSGMEDLRGVICEK